MQQLQTQKAETTNDQVFWLISRIHRQSTITFDTCVLQTGSLACKSAIIVVLAVNPFQEFNSFQSFQSDGIRQIKVHAENPVTLLLTQLMKNL